MNANDFQALFPECKDVRVLPVHTGQKDVAEAKRNDDEVALKIFKKLNGDEDKRVQRELAAVQKLNSEYVPRVYESGVKSVAGEDRYYIIEQFIRGESYADILAREGAQPIPKLLDLIGSLLTACADCAAVGITHRDLKPGNLMLDGKGKLWVIDFGFCRHADLSRATPSGVGVGTPGYSPLEQLKLIPAEINVRADIFATGVIAYEAATGAPTPWRGNSNDVFEIVQKMKTQELPKPVIAGDVDGKLADLIGWFCQRMPTHRPQSAEEAIAAFKDIEKLLRPA